MKCPECGRLYLFWYEAAGGAFHVYGCGAHQWVVKP